MGEWLMLLALVLLPWQTQWILKEVTMVGESSVYGVLSIFVVEALLLGALLLRGRRADGSILLLWKRGYVVLALGFFSLTFAVAPPVSWFFLLHLLSAFVLYMLLTDERTNLQHVAVACLLGLVGPIVLGVWQVVTGGNGASTLFGLAAREAAIPGVAVVETAAGRMMRAYGSLPHPNVFGGYLAVGVGVLVWLVRFVRTRMQLLLALSASVFLGAGLVMTFSRSAWLGVLVGGGWLIGVLLWRKQMPARRFFPIAIVGLCTVLLTLGVFHNQVLARFNPDVRIEVTSVEERASQYAQFGSVAGRNVVTGVGPGNYVFGLYQADPGHPVWSYQPVHNAYLLVLAELGLIGFLAVGWFAYGHGRVVWQRRFTAAGMVGGMLLCSLCVIGLFDHYVWSLWSGLGLSAFVFGFVRRLS